MQETRVGKVKGRDDTYIFVTMDVSRGQMGGMSHGYTQAEIREELRKQGFSGPEIDAMIAHADEHPA